MEVNTRKGVLLPTSLSRHSREGPSMRPVKFGKALVAGTWLTPFSDDKPDCFFTVIKSWMDETLGASLALGHGVPSYQVEHEEGRIHLRIEERMKTAGASSGPIRQALIRGPFLMARWLRNRKDLLRLPPALCPHLRARVFSAAHSRCLRMDHIPPEGGPARDPVSPGSTRCRMRIPCKQVLILLFSRFARSCMAMSRA
jgi:hypothetical protein